MGVVRAAGFRAIGVDGAYSAFPSICRFGSGQLRLVWRQGANHVDARDGVVRTCVSDDNGRTWGAATTAVSAPAGTDLRDPCISTDGTTTWLTYFKGTAALAAAGAFVRGSTDNGVTWGAEVRIDSQPYAAMSAPVAALGGTLLTAFYGKNAGDTRDSSWLARSTDGGATWTTQLVANGQAAGIDYQEPWVVARGSTVWMFFRNGNNSAIGAASSTNSGTTWSAPALMFDDATGRPAAAWLASGSMAVVPRRISDKQPVVRTCSVGAASTAWLPAKRTMIQPPGAQLGMMYAHPLEVPGGIICPVGIETNASTARIHVGWLSEGAGISPLGDQIPDEPTAVASDFDTLLVAEGFTYPDANTLPSQWGLSPANGMRIDNGNAMSGTADNVPELAWQELGTADVDLEGDFWWTGQSGYGLIARVSAGNNYLLLTPETSGANFRLYKVVNGTATQLAVATTSTPPSAWSRLRMVLRGPRIQCFLDGQALIRHDLAAADIPTYAGKTLHGFKLNAQAGGVHRCRRFVAHG